MILFTLKTGCKGIEVFGRCSYHCLETCSGERPDYEECKAKRCPFNHHGCNCPYGYLREESTDECILREDCEHKHHFVIVE